jgi:hypothetical protein
MRYLLSAVLLSTVTFGQSFQGSLRGRVADPNGAVVTLAKITIIDEATTSSRSTITNDQGEYTFASLTPATYTIVVEAPGFKRTEQKGLVVSTQTAVSLDLRLELGMVTEQVNVTAESPLLDTSDASTGQVIDRQKLVDLPNLGRNPFMLSKLSESVVQVGNPKFNRMQDQSGSSQISIAGGPVRGNNYTLDGISITDSTNRAVIIPSQEAVQEMKVQANTYDAEMGRTGGGTFNTFLRSGSNDLRGSAFGYLRQTDWVANNFFSNRAGQGKPDQPFKNYGGSIGGPVILPKIYNGRSKTFFFVTGEAYRQYDASGTRLSVPTALERSGDFSKSLTRTGALQVVHDPMSTRADGTRTPLAGNLVPTSQMSRVGKALASYFPDPNVATAYYGAPNFDSTVRAFNRADQMTFKVDHDFTTWWKASFSYLHYGSQEPSNRWFPNQIASPNQGVIYRKVDATQANSTFTLTPTTVLTVRYGFNRFPNFTPPISLGFDLASLGLPASLVAVTKYPAFPAITLGSDFANYGGGTTSQNVYHSKSINATLSKFIGRHRLKGGFDYRLLHHDGAPGVGPSSFTFGDVFTRSSARTAVTGTGSGLASMLLGYPTGGSQTVGTNFYNFVRYYGFFVQDDIRITSKLTVNFGMRMEHESGPADTNNKFIIGFDTGVASPLAATTGLPIKGSVLYAGVGGNATHAFDPSAIKWGPRFGFAYAADAKTSFRGGYGIFWAPLSFSFQNTLGFSQANPIVTSFDNNFTPAASLDNPYPSGLSQPVGTAGGGLTGVGQSISVYDLGTHSAGYVQQFSLDVQRQLPGSFVLSTGYIGSRGIHLVQDGRNANQLHDSYLSLGTALNSNVANPMYNKGGALSVGNPTIPLSQSLLAFPQFTGVTINSAPTNHSRYDAFYAKVQRRFAAGMTILSTYTWSRSMDMGFGSVGNTYSSVPGGPQSVYNLAAEYGLSAQSTPHRLSMAMTYELPFGKGKAMLANNKLLDYAIGGWSANFVSVLQSGYPLAITQSNNNSVLGASTQRPNATGTSASVDAPFAKRLDGWINPAAFTVAPQFTYGNVSRVIPLRGPGQVNFDVSIFKTFTLVEGLKAQFRAESLNVTNTPMFYGPNTNVSNNAFGTITSQANYPRLIQIGVRLFL